ARRGRARGVAPGGRRLHAAGQRRAVDPLSVWLAETVYAFGGWTFSGSLPMSCRAWLPLILIAATAGICPLVAPAWTELPKEKKQPKEIVNSIGMKLALVPAGKFKMGSPRDAGAASPGCR